MALKQQIYNAALYLRLSRDDAGTGDSSSIQTQRAMLEKYCREQNIRVFDTYIDDGYTGLNYDRPAFQRMIDDIKSGIINMVITKDLSRLGRDYIQTGHYTEMFFPQHGVRYIALNDSIDTLHDNNDIAPFKNILNDMYAKDLSRKVKTAKRTRAAQGAFIGSQPPYGYKTREDNCNILEIDEETAPVVQRIFHMALGGMGAVTIAKKLREEKLLTPAAYKVGKGDTRFAHLYEGKPESLLYHWAYTTVHRTLSDRVYLGHMVNHKSQVLHYKTKQRVIVPKPEHIVVENTHPALISEDDFERVQRLIEMRHSPISGTHENLFCGYVYCDECGHRLGMSTKTYNGISTRFYRCLHHYHYPEECAHTHFIRYDDLYEIIWQDYQRIAEILTEHMDTLISILHETDYQAREFSRLKSQKSKLQTRLKELDRLIEKVFEDSAAGCINAHNHNRLLKQYQQEQESTQQKLDAMVRKSGVEQDPTARYKELRVVAEKHIYVTELSPYLIGELIDKIHIGHAQKNNGELVQDIRIEYRFAGGIPELVKKTG